VAVGTEEIISLIQEDEELASRLRPLRLRGLALDQRFGSFLATLETFFPFQKPSFLPRYTIEIHRRTAGIIGEVVALLNEAAAWAVRNDRSHIDDEAFKKCAYIPQLIHLRA
jgi:hypothetical protein